jgi:hypothetical protein
MTKEYEFSVSDQKSLVWQYGDNLKVGPKEGTEGIPQAVLGNK